MRLITISTVGLLLALLAGYPALAAKDDDPPTLEKEISFGVKMAQRGLWNEALFRFKRAAEFRPDDAKVLNNLAVAYEAVGQYDNALLAYQEALRADAANQELKRNYSRFIEFYQAFKPEEDDPLAGLESEQAAEQESVQEGEAAEEPPSSQGGQ